MEAASRIASSIRIPLEVLMPLKVTLEGGSKSRASMTTAFTSPPSWVHCSLLARALTRFKSLAPRRRGWAVANRLVMGARTKSVAAAAVKARLLC